MLTLSRFAASTLFIASISQGALAAGGLFEINQACVASGCFPGDTAGFPIQLQNGGSYRLTSNINSPTLTAIVVNASVAQIDLAGFTVGGPVTCSGTTLVCTPSSYAPEGISVSATSEGVVIRNGQVKGFGFGVRSGPRGLVEDISTSQNSNTGIFGREGAVIRRSSASANGRAGIEISIGGEITNSTANDNGQFGITTGGTPTNGGATITNSSTYRNGQYGIYDWGRSLIQNCVVNDNKGYGIFVQNGGSSITNSVITANATDGLRIQNSTAFEAAGVTTVLGGNSLTGNNGGSGNAQITGAGAKFFTSPNLCGTSICN